MGTAFRYARYLYDCVKPWLRPPVLEIGSGYGTYTRFLLEHGRVIASDIDTTCLQEVAARFSACDLKTQHLDLNDAASIGELARHGCESAFSSNVFEHIEKDVQAFEALRRVIRPGGYLCVIVPSHPRLYGYMDSQAGHFRRYTRSSLRASLRQAGWSVVRSFYINALGGLGWWVNNRLLPARPLDAPRINNQLVLYDRFIVPVSRVIDRLFARCFGLSVVAVARNDAP
jgi:SAM-dependent methyltransferase